MLTAVSVSIYESSAADAIGNLLFPAEKQLTVHSKLTKVQFCQLSWLNLYY